MILKNESITINFFEIVHRYNLSFDMTCDKIPDINRRIGNHLLPIIVTRDSHQQEKVVAWILLRS